MSKQTWADNVHDMLAELEKLRLDNERLKKEVDSKGKKKIWYKVSLKGAVSIMGMRRIPITLYKDEIDEIFARTEEIRAFMKENKSKLSTRKTDDEDGDE